MNVGEDNVANLPLEGWGDISQLTSFQGYKARLTLLRLGIEIQKQYIEYDDMMNMMIAHERYVQWQYSVQKFHFRITYKCVTR